MKIQHLQLIDPEFRKKIKDSFKGSGGIYVLYWFKNGKSAEVPRLLKTDKEGILYIGKTDSSLYERAGKSLKNSLFHNSDPQQEKPAIKGHNSLSQKFYRVRLHINVEHLYLNLSNEYRTTASSEESFLLDEYTSKFGELPPLNGSYGSDSNWELYQI